MALSAMMHGTAVVGLNKNWSPLARAHTVPTGSLPTSWATFSFLSSLDVSSNLLTGTRQILPAPAPRGTHAHLAWSCLFHGHASLCGMLVECCSTSAGALPLPTITPHWTMHFSWVHLSSQLCIMCCHLGLSLDVESHIEGLDSVTQC